MNSFSGVRPAFASSLGLTSRTSWPSRGSGGLAAPSQSDNSIRRGLGGRAVGGLERGVVGPGDHRRLPREGAHGHRSTLKMSRPISPFSYRGHRGTGSEGTSRETQPGEEAWSWGPEHSGSRALGLVPLRAAPFHFQLRAQTLLAGSPKHAVQDAQGDAPGASPGTPGVTREPHTQS